MRTIFVLIKKELRQIFRNKGMLPIIFILPVIQLIILANAASYEIKNINVAIIDLTSNSISNKLGAKFQGNEYFTLVKIGNSYQEGDQLIDSGEVDALIVLDDTFENITVEASSIQILINAIDGASSGIVFNYIQEVLKDYNIEESNQSIPQAIQLEYTNRFNPKLDYKTMMVPGILVILVSMVGVFLTAMNIAREKEVGTLDQLNVSPIKKHHFVLGKLIPMVIIALFELTFGTVIGILLYGIPFLGNPLVVLVFAIAFLFVMLSLGLLISTQSDSQQQAMLIAYLFLIVFTMFSGLFTSIESMPNWAKTISQTIPVTHFITVLRAVMLKGSSFSLLLKEFLILVFSGSLVMGLALLKYQKVN